LSATYIMQLLSALLAVATTPVDAGHQGRDHRHPIQRRQLGLDSLTDQATLLTPSATVTLAEQTGALSTVSSYVFPMSIIQVLLLLLHVFSGLVRLSS
jgi:hypothetical protein